ncbi:hypothetical protein QYE76_006870 [Lolium multiflorum]|uniref:Retrotransposon gag domain-containing protein n=1 Tax=Lolium multiflorum TaxID=4521 RepID=A0AAD8RVL0_LOLMU|nr:hypothetical protein QYE76_006870 [Lolium multiflorum]
MSSSASQAAEPVKYEDLPPEHKKRYDELKAILEADLIGAFEKTRSHGIKFKGFQPEGALDGLDLSLPSDERTRALRQEVNYAVAHSLHRHAESLVNTLERVALNVVQEVTKHKYSPSGPALGTHQGEVPLYTRPPLQHTFAAPQQQGSPAYVVYKVGGDPGDYQFLKDCHGRRSRWSRKQFGADAEKQAWLTKYATSTSHERSASAAPTVDEITAIMRDKFGILPKKRMIGYSKPYPNDYDLIPLPPKYRLPDFTKFSGSEGTSSIEHVSRYLAQLGMVSASDELRVRFFSQSLTGPAFGWYTSLLPDSVRTWKQLEEQFHVQYHSETTEASLADLTQVRQRRGETVSEYIQRFRTVRNRCYSVRLSEKEAVELAVAGLSTPLKDVTFQAEYNSLAHMVQKLTAYEQRHPELYQDKYKRVALIETDEDEDSAGDQEPLPKAQSATAKNLEEAEAQYLYTLRKARPDLAVKIQQTLETEARPPKKVWRPKQTKADAGTSADTNMVFVLPSEFCAPKDEEVSVAQFDCGPRPVIFEKPRERSYRHLKALYLKGYINGQPISKMLVDTGAAVNIMPYSMLRRLGRSTEDLIKTNVTLSDFNGQPSEAKGVLNVDLTVGRKTIPTSFFIVDSKSTYAVLLGRDWIHANCCIPSTMHQCIIQWDGDEVEVVHADDSIDISLAAMNIWEANDQEPLSGINLDGCERIEATKNGVRLVLSTGLTE